MSIRSEVNPVALFSSKPKTAPARSLAGHAPPEAKPRESTIQVSEIGGQLPPWIEEAVILYATGKTGEATAALNRHILDHPDERDMAPWLMLFDIHETNHRRAFRRSRPRLRRQIRALATGMGAHRR